MVAALMLAALAMVSCEKPFEYGGRYGYISPVRGSSENQGSRNPTELTRNVLLLYSAGYTLNIDTYLKEDVQEFAGGWLPSSKAFSKDVVLVYAHLPVRSGNFRDLTSPVLMRLYAGHDGNAVMDTLKVYDPGTISASASQLNEVLSYIYDRFPAEGYGMVMSSHGSGYLPQGFLNNPDTYVYSGPEPAQKSFGADQDYSGTGPVSREIEIQDLAQAIPMKLDYLLFDACYMGGVEVAYELREKCAYVGFSQAEVLADGFNYANLSSHLLLGDAPDPLAVCEEYFQQYDVQSGIWRSATVSLIDCGRMQPLADVCRMLCEKYRSGLDEVNSHRVQGFFRGGAHWFYDLQDMFVKAGISDDDQETLQAALDECVAYKAATPSFMIGSSGGFYIDAFSGFSMYLPANGNPELDKYYRTLEWNKATSLVK